jgi:hypothetical protein
MSQEINGGGGKNTFPGVNLEPICIQQLVLVVFLQSAASNQVIIQV